MSDAKEECIAILKILTKTNYVLFTKRCNAAITLAFQCAKEHEGRTHVLKQEEGGWLTYHKFAVQLGLECTSMVTLDGAIVPKELSHYGSDELLIVNSLAGYVTPLPMDELVSSCLQQDIFLVNDVSASIGTDLATHGDILVGSFGPAKPINLGEGGFLATNDKELFDACAELQEEEPLLPFELLAQKLKNLAKRREFLESRTHQIKQDLQKYAVVQPEAKHSLNVLVRYSSPEEKQELIQYCKENNLEFEECPREIRLLDDAISIEVKRLEE